MKKTKIDWADYTPQGKPLQTKQGYILVCCPEHPNANKGRKKAYLLEHRLVMSNYLKRALKSDECVHHINGDKSDNRIENLKIYSNSDHMRHHGKNMDALHKRAFKEGGYRYSQTRRKERTQSVCACGCGEIITTVDSKGRIRKYKHGHNQRGKNWTWGGNK